MSFEIYLKIRFLKIKVWKVKVFKIKLKNWSSEKIEILENYLKMEILKN